MVCCFLMYFLERPVKFSICGARIFTPTAGEVTNVPLLPQVGQFEALIFILFILGNAEEGRGVVLFVCFFKVKISLMETAWCF